jgi:preprotein translocase subunit YajC
VLFILPSRRKQAAQRHMLEGLEVGDEIVTVGGIIGEVRELEENEVLLEIAPETTIRLARRAVAAIVPRNEDVEDAESGAEEQTPTGTVEAKPR